MKKLLSLLLVFAVLFSLAGCSKAPLKEDEYVAVVNVNIKPKFDVYIDADGNAVKIEPLDDDAKLVMSDFNFANKNYKQTIGNLITHSGTKGFVDDDTVMFITLTQNKNGALDEATFKTEVKQIADRAVMVLALNARTRVQVDLNQGE